MFIDVIFSVHSHYRRNIFSIVINHYYHVYRRNIFSIVIIDVIFSV